MQGVITMAVSGGGEGLGGWGAGGRPTLAGWEVLWE